MAFWTDINNTSREPLRSNRWLLRFGNNSDLSIDNFVYGLKECAKPSFDISVTEHTHISGHVFRNPGILKWKPITVKFASINNQKLEIKSSNYTGISLARNFYNSIVEFGYGINTLTNELLHKGILKSQIYKNNTLSPTIDIIQIDDNGNEQEIWTLYNSFISNINFGNLSYNSDDIVDITLTFNYDYAIQKDILIKNKESEG